MTTQRDTIVVVGGYGSVGSAAAEALARTFPARVVVAGRDPARALGSRRRSSRGSTSHPTLVDNNLYTNLMAQANLRAPPVRSRRRTSRPHRLRGTRAARRGARVEVERQRTSSVADGGRARPSTRSSLRKMWSLSRIVPPCAVERRRPREPVRRCETSGDAILERRLTSQAICSYAM